MSSETAKTKVNFEPPPNGTREKTTKRIIKSGWSGCEDGLASHFSRNDKTTGHSLYLRAIANSVGRLNCAAVVASHARDSPA